MMVIRSSQAVPDGMSDDACMPDPLQEQVAEVFAGQLAADRVPSIVRSVLSSTSASPGRSGRETTSLRELQGGRKVPLREQSAGRGASS
jgi:hypothetical protein